MTDVDLATGAVLAEYDGGAPPEATSVVVGAPPQWDDEDDDTFAIVNAIVDVVEFYGNASAPVVGDATKAAAIFGVIRWLPDDGPATPGLMRAVLRVDGLDAAVSTWVASGVGFQNGSIGFFSENVQPGAGFTWAEITAAVVDDRVELVLGMGEIPPGGNPLATIYDVHLYAHYLDRRIAAPARLHPREDGLGVGGARLFPRPASHQSSGRFAGGYY